MYKRKEYCALDGEEDCQMQLDCVAFFVYVFVLNSSIND
jgi:hypothetical protein